MSRLFLKKRFHVMRSSTYGMSVLVKWREIFSIANPLARLFFVVIEKGVFATWAVLRFAHPLHDSTGLV